MKTHDVAVVGMACVFPKAATIKQYWTNLVNGNDCLGPPPPGRWGKGDGPGRVSANLAALFPHLRGGFLPAELRLDSLRFGITPKAARTGEPEQMLMIQVIDQALQDAGVADSDPLRERTDVVLGRGGYSNYHFSELSFHTEAMPRVLESLRVCFPQLSAREVEDYAAQMLSTMPSPGDDNLPSLLPNLVASQAAIRLNLRGTAYAIDAACASSLLAVEQAVNRLRLGLCDLAVAGGVQLCQFPTVWRVFHLLQALSPSGHIRPFDRRADGLLLGEGAGAVILKRLEDAQRDGDCIYAIVKGVGSSSDGRETDILAPSVAGQLLALERAFADARLDRDTIGYLEAHGTATVEGDRAELQTIQTFFGKSSGLGLFRGIGSVKANIGHAMSAAGIASFIKAALVLSNKIWPPSLHCQEPRPEMRDQPFCPYAQIRPWIHPPGQTPRRAGINAFGFGGVNVHVVMEELPQTEGSPLRSRPIQSCAHRAKELFVFSAPSPEVLATRLERASAYCTQARDDLDLGDLAYTLAEEVDFSLPCKLALVCPGKEHMLSTLSRCRQGLLTNSLRTDETSGLFYSSQAAYPPGKTAFVFPGFGFPGMVGNYPQHLLDMAVHFPEVRAELDKLEAKDQHPEDPVPFSSILSPPPFLSDEQREQLKRRLAPTRSQDESTPVQPPTPSERNLGGVGVAISNWIGWALLRQFRIPMDITCGTSGGEVAALCAGGLVDFEKHVRPHLWEGLAIDPGTGLGCLVFVSLSAEQLQPFLQGLSETQIAIHLTPESQIVGGSFREIDLIVERLRQQKIMAQKLPFVPVHTARMTPIRDKIFPLYSLDEDIRFGEPQATVFSSLTAHPYPQDPCGVRDLLMGNIDRPVLFWQTYHRLYQEGVRVFVQVGGGTLAANIKTILHWDDVVTISQDVEFRDPITQLNNLCGTLFTAGVRLTLEPLFRHRTPRSLALDQRGPVEDALPTAVPLALQVSYIPTTHLRPCRGGSEPERRHPSPSSQALPERSTTEVSCRLPFLGKVLNYVPGQEVLTEHTISLDEDLFIQDHCFVHGQEHKPLEDCFPVVPMTAMLEMMAETAACLAPGLGLIGYEDVRALRWVLLDGVRSVTVQLRARVLPDQGGSGTCVFLSEIQYGNQVYSSALVLFADHYQQSVNLHFSDLDNPAPWPFTATQAYEEKYIFHGPRFQCIADMGVQSQQGFLGELTVLPRDNLFSSNRDPELLEDFCTFDGAGQLFLLWLEIRDMLAFPLSVRKIEFYRPPPDPGTRVLVRGEITDINTFLRTATGNLEVQDGAGGVWMRAQGLTYWIATRSRTQIDYLRLPARKLLSTVVSLPQSRPGEVCVQLSAREWNETTQNLLAHVSLSNQEWATYKGLPSEGQRTFLLGRIVAKDAVRQWYSQKSGATEFHPLALEIAKDSQGRPHVLATGIKGPLPQISIAHTEQDAVALVSNSPAGIDIEMASRDVQAILSDFASPEELAILHPFAHTCPEDKWPLRLWCAKEALGKALGTGLNGRPRDFRLLSIHDRGTLTLRHGPTSEEYEVFSFQQNGFMISQTRI